MNNLDHTTLIKRMQRVERTPFGEWLPSPCMSVCSMHPQTGWCLGCYRSLAEIAEWANMSPHQQRDVWNNIHQRMASETS
ncbi:MAG: DUF1289 domain-containing protein [Betaproteobacteria bacterium]